MFWPLVCSVLVQGAGPSARYAHTLSLVANRFLVAMGGNDGKSTLGDAWALDTSEKPYQWRKITDAGEMPSPRWVWRAARELLWDAAWGLRTWLLFLTNTLAIISFTKSIGLPVARVQDVCHSCGAR